MAIVDHFRRRGATLVATSHYDALKTYASTTDGVASAAFGFDAETFAPTYQLHVRIAGTQPGARDRRRGSASTRRSSPRRAQNLSAREAQLAEHLAKIDKDMRALEHEQRLAARERETLGAAEAQDARARRGAAPARGDVPPAAERAARDRAAAGAPGDRRRHRGPEGQERSIATGAAAG